MNTFLRFIGVFLLWCLIGAAILFFGTFIIGTVAAIVAGIINLFSWAFASQYLISSDFIFNHLGSNLLLYFGEPLVLRVALLIDLLFGLLMAEEIVLDGKVNLAKMKCRINEIIKRSILKRKRFRLIEEQEIYSEKDIRSEYKIQYKTVFGRWKDFENFAGREHAARARYADLQKVDLKPVRNVYILE